MIRRPLIRLLFGAGLILAWAGSAWASGLQVAPVSLTLVSTQNADGLWLSNTGTGMLHAQVRVYRWTQVDGAEQLTPSQELVISPPMLGAPLTVTVPAVPLATPPAASSIVDGE